MPKVLVYALHGFLGQSSDWNAVKNYTLANVGNDTKLEIDWIAPELFANHSPPIQEFEDYVNDLDESITTDHPGYAKKIFIGYSMGGRLGLHLLDHNPSLFDHYFFLSTNPSATKATAPTSGEKDRLLSDMRWASQINEKNWDSFLQDWNNQSVFAGSHEPARDLKSYDLVKLRQALVMWSVANQQDFSELLKEFQARYTWVVGSSDQKYNAEAEELTQKKILSNFERISCGHRIWLEKPDEIGRILLQQFRLFKLLS